jgi:RNA polymerase sigma-70 factor (ECF subfamily)
MHEGNHGSRDTGVADERALLAAAAGGDSGAFESLVAPHRRELHVHCYRILGSFDDAEDALQETLLSAWQGLASFERRSSVRTWLYRIATNRCLDMLRGTRRRAPVTGTPGGVDPPAPTRMSRVSFLQPYPDDLLDEHLVTVPDPAPGPDAVLESREAASLAFTAALQLLPPRQRAALILRDVLGYRAAEVATMLAATEESVTSALKRARATLGDDMREQRRRDRAPEVGSLAERAVVARFVDALVANDVDGIVAMLTHDAWVKMPPMPFEYRGPHAARRFFTAITPPGGRQVRVVHTRANRQPAFGRYARYGCGGAWRGSGLLVLTLAGDAVSEVVRFDPTVMARFGMARLMPDDWDGDDAGGRQADAATTP